MKNKYWIILICLILFNIKLLCQSSDSYCSMSRTLSNILEKYHYQPITSKSELSKRVYSLFVQSLDPHSLYFMAADTNILALCKPIVEGGFEGRSCNSFDIIINLYRKRLFQADSMITQSLQKPFNFMANDSISFGSNDSIYFASDPKAYKKRWNKWLKYQALQFLFSPDSTNDRPFAKDNMTLLSKEFKIRNKVKVRETRNIKRILEYPTGFENHVASLFYNAITNSYDPHSAYLSGTDELNLESDLSSDALSYGFEIENTPYGTVQVSRIIPGGPAWKSNDIHKGDILVQVKWPSGQTVDLSDLDQDEVEDIIQTSGSDRMELTVKKVNGQLKTIKLIQEKLEADENLIKSFILNGAKSIGYITLPGFYTEWENQDATGCSNDMAKEIIKLKKENIEGIIIDLRNNGGGAMNEALSLAGIFIDEGPLCISRNRDEKPLVLKDMNRGTIYDGPLAIMVNGLSASASEIMAAALQDYHRAVIVGSPTFGKATGQIIVPIDPLSQPGSNKSSLENPGFVKTTTSKFYRLNGTSYQQKGVIPDVILPEYDDRYTSHEILYPYSLVPDSIVKKVYYRSLPDLPLKSLSEKSKLRLVSNASFKQIEKDNISLQLAFKQLRTIPLNMETFRKKEENIFTLLQSADKQAEGTSNVYTVENVKFDVPVININSYKKEVNDLLLQNIQKDIYIEEAYHVINDFINQK
jgi:carboxyl-terminal processing protease